MSAPLPEPMLPDQDALRRERRFALLTLGTDLDLDALAAIRRHRFELATDSTITSACRSRRRRRQ